MRLNRKLSKSDGISGNDAFGFFFGNNDLGLGSAEVNSASGDSGGPAIHNGEIIGITSYGVTLTFNDGTTSDVNGILDSSFGEFSGDTRVSAYAGFIDDSVGGSTDDGGDTGEPKCNKGMQKRHNDNQLVLCPLHFLHMRAKVLRCHLCPGLIIMNSFLFDGL